MVPWLQMATDKPSTTEDPTSKLKRREVKPEPLSLELFNWVAGDLDDRGEINLKKYSKYLNKKVRPT